MFICASMDEHLGCFLLLPTVDSAAIKISLNTCFQNLGYVPLSGIYGSQIFRA